MRGGVNHRDLYSLHAFAQGWQISPVSYGMLRGVYEVEIMMLKLYKMLESFFPRVRVSLS